MPWSTSMFLIKFTRRSSFTPSLELMTQNTEGTKLLNEPSKTKQNHPPPNPSLVIVLRDETSPAAPCSPWSRSRPWAGRWCRSGPCTGRGCWAATWTSCCTLRHRGERGSVMARGRRGVRGQAAPGYRGDVRHSDAHVPAHLLWLSSWSLAPPASTPAPRLLREPQFSNALLKQRCQKRFAFCASVKVHKRHYSSNGSTSNNNYDKRLEFVEK